MKKNVLLSEALHDEIREVQISTAVALFGVILFVSAAIFWVVDSGGYGVMDALINAMKFIVGSIYALTLIIFGGGHALDRGKRARYYYHALAKCPPTARGRRL